MNFPAFTSQQSKEATITADRSSGFVASQVFDLGQVATFYIFSTITASDPDGETWGTSPGQIAIDQEAFRVSADGDAWKTVSVNEWYTDVSGGPASASFSVVWFTARYVQISNFRIVNSDFNVYSGANNPTASAQYNISYLSSG